MKQLQLLIFLCCLTSFGQNFNSESYTVTRDDLETNTFLKDSTANAIVIYEYGNTYVDKNTFKLTTKIKKKIKILNKKGLDNATFVVGLFNNESSKETFSDLIATTYNFSNEKITTTKLDSKNIFKEKRNDNVTLVKFTLPNIQEGSVITCSYSISSPFYFNFKGWEFQDDIPKLYSEYNTSIPANYDYNIKLVGSLKLVTHEGDVKRDCLTVFNGGHADCSVFKYVMKDIPAFKEEDYMTTRNNYLSRVDYELKTFQGFDGTIKHYTKSWETADKDFKKDNSIGRQLNKSGLFKDITIQGLSDATNSLDKANIIYNHIQENYTWDESYRIFKDVSVKKLLKEKSGNVSEINILLHNILRDYNVEVKPLLLSTRKNGLPTTIYPVISEFNYIIVQAVIDGKTYLLDATDKYLSFGQIPFRCLNQYGRLLDFKNGSSWLDIEPLKRSSLQYRCDLELDDTNTISGKVVIKSTGYHALKNKKNYYENKMGDFKVYSERYPEIQFEDAKSTGSIDESMFTKEFNITKDTEDIGGNIYIDPFLFKFFNKNPFTLAERTYPIDFGYKETYVYNIKIKIDDIFEVVEIPKNFNQSLKNNKGRFTMQSKQEDNTILLYFRLNFNEAIYDSSYYTSLKSFMDEVVRLQTKSLIVLKKK